MNDHHVLPSLSGGGPPIVGAVGRSAFSPSSKGGGIGKAKLSDLKLGSTGAVEMSTFQVPAEVCVLVVCVHAGMHVCGCVCVWMCVCACMFSVLQLVVRRRIWQTSDFERGPQTMA